MSERTGSSEAMSEFPHPTGFRPDRYDLVGAALCLVGVAVIRYAPRAS